MGSWKIATVYRLTEEVVGSNPEAMSESDIVVRHVIIFLGSVCVHQGNNFCQLMILTYVGQTQNKCASSTSFLSRVNLTFN